MPRYISLMRLTDKGLQNIKHSAERRAQSEQRVAALGGRSLAFYVTLGPYDFLQIFEMPDDASMMQYLLTARRDGFVEPLVFPAIDTETYGEILAGLPAEDVRTETSPETDKEAAIQARTQTMNQGV